MAATNYTSRNILWSVITALADGDFVTMTALYDEALKRLHDGQGALLGRIATVYSDLVSQATGTKARIVGNVDMTAFNYNSGIALNGLTVVVDEDTTTAQTCTFDNAVTGPDVLLTQLTAQAGTNLVWSLNESGYLVVQSKTVGTGSTIALGSGTAHSTIWPSPTITSPGAGTVNDGGSRIGLAAIGSLPAGTLRSMLVAIESVTSGVAASIASRVAKAGDTMYGNLAFGSGTKVVYSEAVERPARGQWVLSSSVTDLSISEGGGTLTQIATAQAVVTADYVFYPITGDTMTGIKISVNATGSGHSGMPATKPSITLWKWVYGAIAPSIVAGPIEDPETTVVDYEAIHEVEITGLSEVIASNARYFLRFSSEDGANQTAGYIVTHVSMSVTSGGIPPGL